MTAGHRNLIDSLFERALALQPGEREAFLEAECTDEEVVREVLSLLSFAGPGSTILAAPVEAMASHLPAGSVREGSLVGPYRLLREIGRGGMGAVFLAARDGEFRKTVAVKFLQISIYSEAAVRRFRQERQILAELEHPNIARLLDGGATEDGMPYLVMEYVEGTSITSYARDNGLTTPQKLRLFRQLCDGVQYAHSKLVVHRDIKPGNILVTTAGVPKLLDFGIAKLTTPLDVTGETVPETVTVMRMMTPDYASPEQVRGESATVVSDVYALGTVLFELLTGERAHRLRTYDALELVREICESEPRAPSTTGAQSPKGDLDNIVLKAMQKDPARRYNSAEQFSEDLRRYLEGLPVLARPDTLLYRTRKFARRHWFSLTAAAALFLALAGGAIAALRQARIAEARFQEGRKLANRLFDIHDEVAKLPGSTAPREMIVRSALDYLDKLAPAAGDDPAFAWELAKAYEKTGDAQGNPTHPSLGKTKEAVASYEKALKIQESLLQRGALDAPKLDSLIGNYNKLTLAYRQLRDNANTLRTSERAVALSASASDAAAALAYSSLGFAQELSGDADKAFKTLQIALALGRKTTEGKPIDAPEQSRLGNAYLIAADAANRAARFDESLALNKKAIEIFEKRLAAMPPDGTRTREITLSYERLGDTLGATDRPSLGRHAEAIPYYRKALAMSEQMAAEDPKNRTAHFDIARAAGKLATQLDVTDPKEAIRLYEQSLAAAEQLFPNGAERLAVEAAYYNSVAVPLAKLGRWDQAQADMRRSLSIYDAMLKQNPTNLQLHMDVSDVWRVWGMLQCEHGQMKEGLGDARIGLQYARESVQMAPKSLPAAWRVSFALAVLRDEEEKWDRASHTSQYAAEAASARSEAAKLWAEWDKRQPNTPFIQEQKRMAEKLRPEDR
jgi:serine/threonine protein kinase